MAEAAAKLAVKSERNKPEAAPPATRGELWPFDRLRSEIDRLFDDFGIGPWRSPLRRTVFDVEPFWRGEISWGKVPAVDVAETAKGYEITADLPGIDEKNVEVKYADGTLTIKGEKKDENEEKRENYYLSERNCGSFQRSFRAGRRRCRQGRGFVQERSLDRHIAEDAGSAEERETHRDQAGLRSLLRILATGPGRAKSGRGDQRSGCQVPCRLSDNRCRIAVLESSRGIPV